MTRIYTERKQTYPVTVDLIVWECPSCGIVYGIPKEFADRCRAKGERYYCPNGHSLGWHETDSDRLREAQAQLVASQDQLRAAVEDAERMRVALVRDRSRFANGVCPCCNQSFPQLTRHMKTQHPDYDPERIDAPTYECSCGREFESFHGLRIHQGLSRSDDWSEPHQIRWRSHLTVAAK